MMTWKDECYTGVEMLRAAATIGISDIHMKKYRKSDNRQTAKAIAKRRKRNKNKKTHML